MNAVEDFAYHLRHLHAAAGAPSRRQMAGQTGYGKSTISEAFGGRRLPTWQVVGKLAAALGADVEDLRDRWVAARGRPTLVQPVPDWLTSVRTGIPEITTGPSLEEACAIAPKDPKRALAASWEVLRVCALQLARCYYGDIPGSWSSNVVETYQRAEKDGLLPAGVTAVASTVHYRHVGSSFPGEELPSTAELFQIIVLAYRLAWQARDVVEIYEETGKPPP
ncbi:helix-turn-helix domain-containing protein [Streptomyces goshikiensis]|uniref:helix-turn-helix domain-containing protein n=1 Tax=Streptomyces goshikiensis TaxID=1942 RepID=UPI003675AE6E